MHQLWKLDITIFQKSPWIIDVGGIIRKYWETNLGSPQGDLLMSENVGATILYIIYITLGVPSFSDK